MWKVYGCAKSSSLKGLVLKAIPLLLSGLSNSNTYKTGVWFMSFGSVSMVSRMGIASTTSFGRRIWWRVRLADWVTSIKIIRNYTELLIFLLVLGVFLGATNWGSIIIDVKALCRDTLFLVLGRQGF